MPEMLPGYVACVDTWDHPRNLRHSALGDAIGWRDNLQEKHGETEGNHRSLSPKYGDIKVSCGVSLQILGSDGKCDGKDNGGGWLVMPPIDGIKSV